MLPRIALACQTWFSSTACGGASKFVSAIRMSNAHVLRCKALRHLHRYAKSLTGLGFVRCLLSHRSRNLWWRSTRQIPSALHSLSMPAFEFVQVQTSCICPLYPSSAIRGRKIRRRPGHVGSGFTVLLLWKPSAPAASTTI